MDRVNIEMIEHQQHRTHSKAWLKKDANNTNDLDDSKKIQIESVDSSLRDESVYIPEEKTSDLKENNSRLMRTERKQREIDAKQQAAKYKKVNTDGRINIHIFEAKCGMMNCIFFPSNIAT